MLIYFIICLSITLYVIEDYILSGFHSKYHRLLPLVLGLGALYDFYVIVEYISDYDAVFVVLKDLLLVQMIYLLLYYIIDFMEIKFPRVVNLTTFTGLVVADILLFLQMKTGDKYGNIMLAYIAIYVIITLIVSTWAFIKKQISGYERMTYILLYLSIWVSGIPLIIVKVFKLPGELIMPAAMAMSCVMIQYLVVKGRIIDTTQLLQKEIYDISDVSTFIYDANLYYLDCNKAARDNFSEAIKIMEKNRDDYFNKDLLEDMTHNINTEYEYVYGDYYYKCKLNTFSQRGKTKGYILQILDITKQKQETSEMEEKKNQAEELARLKSNFLARMSHDLRSPLHAIIGGSNILLERDEMSVRSHIMVEHIKDAGNELLQLVNSILDYSKLDAGHLVLQNEKYDFKKMVYDQSHIVFVNLWDKKVDFEIRLVDSCPRYLIGDQLRVMEILQNILSNAIKFTDGGKITATFGCEKIDSSHVKISFLVEDTGTGIPKSVYDNLFNEYVSYSDTKTQEGTGLGLSIVKQLAELMEGSVNIYSDGINGTKVNIFFIQEFEDSEYIPPFVVNDDPTTTQQERFDKPFVREWKYPEAKVLLADDMAVNRQIFKAMTESYEFNLTMVEDGRKAIDAALNNEFDLIILDYMMPEISGIDAADEILKCKKIPVVALSADISDDTKKKFLSHGFCESLDKPIDPQALDEVFYKYIDESYRVKNDDEESYASVGNIEHNKYIKALQSYVREVSEIREHLEEYLENDLDMYRTKVHGIKGISRQLGRARLGDNAEVMEMAVKAGHIEFIRNHIVEFLRDVDAVLGQAQNELERAKIEEDIQVEEDEKRVEAAMNMLKEGFLEFDIDLIEGGIDELSKLKLTDSEREILEKSKLAYEAFDYEEGSKLFD